jgi:hypothetical protein
MSRSGRAFAATLLALALLAPAGALAQTSISLIAIPGEGLLGPDIDRIENAMRERVPKLGGYEFHPRQETMEHVTEARDLGIDCAARDVECATKIGVIAGADQVLLVRAEARDGSFFLTLLLVELAKPDAAQRITQWAPTSGAAFDRALDEVSTRLFAPDRYLGALKVRLTPPAAQVLLDGQPAPPTDASGVMQGLVPGDHAVEVKLPGYKPFKGTVQVRFAETSELAVALVPLEEATNLAHSGGDAPPAADGATGDATDAPADDGAAAGAAPAADAPLPILPIVGGGVMGAGALTAAVGLGVILLADPIVGDPTIAVDERNTWRALGLGGIGAAVIGGIVFLAGAGVLAYGLVAPEP